MNEIKKISHRIPAEKVDDIVSFEIGEYLYLGNIIGDKVEIILISFQRLTLLSYLKKHNIDWKLNDDGRPLINIGYFDFNAGYKTKINSRELEENKQPLLEGISIYKVEVLLKTDARFNKVEIYNQVRALRGVVVVTIEQNDYLEKRATDLHEYSLLHMKYIGQKDPEAALNGIKSDALRENKIIGILQFIPRPQTIIKIGAY